MVMSGVSLAFPRLTDLLSIPPPLLTMQNKEQRLSKQTSRVLPGALMVKCRKHLLCPKRPILDMVYLFLKLQWFLKCVVMLLWKTSQAPTQGNSQFFKNDFHSWIHSSLLLGSLIKSSYELDIRTLITLLNVCVANNYKTPNIYLRTLKEQPCAILYMVNPKPAHSFFKFQKKDRQFCCTGLLRSSKLVH